MQMLSCWSDFSLASINIDHEAMASCYHSSATFEDIAFDLRGVRQIHAMWHMICERDIRVTFEVLDADEHNGRVNVVDDYTFSSTGLECTM